MDKFLKNVLLKNYTTFKIGGPAKYFFVAKNIDSLISAVKEAKKLKIPVFILGGGSNLLVSDKGFKGLAIKPDMPNVEFQKNKAIVGAGVHSTKLAYLSAEKGLSGLEWAAGMPGNIGGAIYGNAQAFGSKISDIVESVEALNLKTLKLRTFSKEQCHFSLKNSFFKKNKNWVIISAVLRLKSSESNKVKSQIKEFLEYRRIHHPMNFPSAGSVFVNPEKDGVAIPAGRLIAECGLAGKKIGQAQISEKHCNFIVNLGGAKAKDVLLLIKLAQKKVKQKFNINLTTEIQIL